MHVVPSEDATILAPHEMAASLSRMLQRSFIRSAQSNASAGIVEEKRSLCLGDEITSISLKLNNFSYSNSKECKHFF